MLCRWLTGRIGHDNAIDACGGTNLRKGFGLWRLLRRRIGMAGSEMLRRTVPAVPVVAPTSVPVVLSEHELPSAVPLSVPRRTKC